MLAAHEATWVRRWGCSDVEVEGDPAAQQALRFAAYHLNGAANPDDPLIPRLACSSSSWATLASSTLTF